MDCRTVLESALQVKVTEHPVSSIVCEFPGVQIPFENVFLAREITCPAVHWIVFSSVLVLEEGEKFVNTGTVEGVMWLQMYSSVQVSPAESV